MEWTWRDAFEVGGVKFWNWENGKVKRIPPPRSVWRATNVLFRDSDLTTEKCRSWRVTLAPKNEARRQRDLLLRTQDQEVWCTVSLTFYVLIERNGRDRKRHGTEHGG